MAIGILLLSGSPRNKPTDSVLFGWRKFIAKCLQAAAALLTCVRDVVGGGCGEAGLPGPEGYRAGPLRRSGTGYQEHHQRS